RETAILDEDMVASLAGTVTGDTLTQAGYLRAAYLFPRSEEAEKQLWTMRQGFSTYGAAAHFRLPVSYRDSLLTGAVTVTRDAYDCVVTQVQDAAGLTTTAGYDWRFLTPVRVTDVNDNVHTITLDALGRMTTLRFCGTENNTTTGYSVSCIWRMGSDRLPPHVVTLTTDRFDGDPGQQESLLAEVPQEEVIRLKP
ncbi:SpvB/TcaC N-terminal domain-containing protein, partial [Enterobacter asburiae]